MTLEQRLSDASPCVQTGCELPGAFRFTWPARDEEFACIFHARQIVRIAEAIDLHLQLQPTTELLEVLEGARPWLESQL